MRPLSAHAGACDGQVCATLGKTVSATRCSVFTMRTSPIHVSGRDVSGAVTVTWEGLSHHELFGRHREEVRKKRT